MDLVNLMASDPVPKRTRLASSARFANAAPKRAAASQRIRSDFADILPHIEPDMSTRIKVLPLSAGTFTKEASNARSMARLNWFECSVSLYADQNLKGSCFDLATSSGSAILAAIWSNTSVETPALRKLRRLRNKAMYPIVGITASQAFASIPPSIMDDKDSHVIPLDLRYSVSLPSFANLRNSTPPRLLTFSRSAATLSVNSTILPSQSLTLTVGKALSL